MFMCFVIAMPKHVGFVKVAEPGYELLKNFYTIHARTYAYALLDFNQYGA